MYTLYTDDSIVAGPNQEDLDDLMEDMKKSNLVVTLEGTLEYLFGVNINRRKDGIIHLTQPLLIQKIVKDLGQENHRTPSKSTLSQPSKILHPH